MADRSEFKKQITTMQKQQRRANLADFGATLGGAPARVVIRKTAQAKIKKARLEAERLISTAKSRKTKDNERESNRATNKPTRKTQGGSTR